MLDEHRKVHTNNSVAQGSRRVEAWLQEYSSYHQNHTNELLHWVCVPLIMVSLLALLWSIPMPQVIADTSEWINPAMLLAVVAIIFYVRLSIQLAIGMFVIAGSSIWMIHAASDHSPSALWQGALVVFAIAWIGQFIGHKIEGKKPAFFKDIQFLLIGPIWLLSFVYQRLGIQYRQVFQPALMQ